MDTTSISITVFALLMENKYLDQLSLLLMHVNSVHINSINKLTRELHCGKWMEKLFSLRNRLNSVKIESNILYLLQES